MKQASPGDSAACDTLSLREALPGDPAFDLRRDSALSPGRRAPAAGKRRWPKRRGEKRGRKRDREKLRWRRSRRKAAATVRLVREPSFDWRNRSGERIKLAIRIRARRSVIRYFNEVPAPRLARTASRRRHWRRGRTESKTRRPRSRTRPHRSSLTG